MEKLPKRKSARLKNYDYNTPDAYFVTICTNNRKCLFSNIVGAIHESPENKLTPYGEIVEDTIQTTVKKYNVEIPKYVIMPNHIHLLIVIKCDNERAIRESPLRYRSLISNIVGYLKMNVSKEFHKTNPQRKIWQRGYHDHIIRNDEDYAKIYEYIDTNVLRWKADCFYID